MRSMSLVDQITLTNAPAPENVTLALSLESRAAREVLPADVAACLEAVRTSRRALQSAIALEANTPADAREERADLGGAWTGLSCVVQGHREVRKHPRPARKASAERLFGLLFGASGMEFLAASRSHQEVFGDSSARLLILEEHAALLHELGAPELAEAIGGAQDAFGKAAGFTAPPQSTGVAGALDQLRNDVRAYVGELMAWARDGEQARAIAEQLLQPWATWDPSSGGSSGSAPDGSTGQSGSTGPTAGAETAVPPTQPAPALDPADSPFEEP